MKTRYNMYFEQTQQILHSFEEESTTFAETLCSIKEYHTNSNHRESTAVDENSEKEYESDEIQTNLNKIRFLLKEMRQRRKALINLNNRKVKRKTSDTKSLVKLENRGPQNNESPPNHINLKQSKSELVLLVERVPRLIPEEFVQRCQGCDINFGLCTWKYHCRVCGFVFCFYCSWNFDNFLPFYMYAVRICNKCISNKKNKCYLNI